MKFNSAAAGQQVCVIGAGVCGLVSIKSCLENGLQVTCFERSADYGGLWCYREPSSQSERPEPSVMRTTILNTSKELSAFSDFPPPSELPNFMRHELYMDYIRSYVEHFKLLTHIKFRHEIVHCEPQYCKCQNDEATNKEEQFKLKWLVRVKDLKSGETFERHFDRLMVAIGHHNLPYTPTFQDQHKFKGLILHSASLRDIPNDERVKNKRVAVIGIGNSACDAATDLAMVARKCYVSCHRGAWFHTRLTPKGLYDFEEKNRLTYYKSKWVSKASEERRIMKKLESRTNHKLLGLSPKHKPSEAVPAINDLFPYRVFTGTITLKGELVRFTENGCVFRMGDEDEEQQVDVVIVATGYTARVPFMNEFELGLKSPEHDEYELYLNMFAPKLSVATPICQLDKSALVKLDTSKSTALEINNKNNPTDIQKRITRDTIKSLAFIGLAQPQGSILVISELQARLATLVFAGRCDLPSIRQMVNHIERLRAYRDKSVNRTHSRDQIVGNWIGYQDLVAGLFGAKPDMRALFFKDFALWKRLMFGPSVSYQYRLTGPGSWEKARETIMSVDQRVYEGINEGKNHILYKSRRKRLNAVLSQPAKK